MSGDKTDRTDRTDRTDQLLDSIRSEFCINIENDNSLVKFRKGELKYELEYNCYDDELRSSLEHICSQLKVMYEGSRTEELCKQYSN
jgi:hypothetical protein